MDLLRGGLRRELERRKIAVALPEERDARLRSLPADAQDAAAAAREGQLSGWLLLSDIRRWHTDGRSPLRAWVVMRLVRIDSGEVRWESEVQKISPLVGSGRLDEASNDAVKAILREVFRP
jgi:hypothetical protein